MNPLRLRATNLRSFPNIDWQIPEGIAAIIGPNGAGKSTLLGAIELALFADGSRDLAPALGPFGERLEIALEFEHDGETYRVRRGFAKGKATLDFEIEREGDQPDASGFVRDHLVHTWWTISRESVRETQALIETTLGLSRQTFNASAFLAQGNAAAFCEAAPAERKAILGAILDPHALWPGLAQRALSERRIVEQDVLAIQAKIDARAPQAEQVPELWREVDRAGIRVQQADAQHQAAASVLEQALAAQTQNEAAVERARAAKQAVDAARIAQSNAADLLAHDRHESDQLAHVQAALTTLAQREAEIPALERQVEETRNNAQRVDAARAAHGRALLRIDELTSRRDQRRRERERIAGELLDYEEDDPHCARCDQRLGLEARETAMRNCRGDLSALDTGLAKLAEEIAGADEERERLEGDLPRISTEQDATIIKRLESARQAAQERASLVRPETYGAAAERIPMLTQALADAEHSLAEAEHALNQALSDRADPDFLERKVAEARLTASNRRVDLDEDNAAHTRAQAALEQAKQAAEELAELANKGALLHQQLDTLKLAERACGRDGIPALIAENTCATIESEANRVLERIPTASGTTFRLEIRTQRALKGDLNALRETLEILVSDRQTSREFATFSGGERFRVAFALRWSLARLLANRRGAESRLLVIDEPDGLDAGGMDGLAAVLREEAGGFSRILVVSHNPLLASAFQQVIEIESDGEVSRIGSSLPLTTDTETQAIALRQPKPPQTTAELKEGTVI